MKFRFHKIKNDAVQSTENKTIEKNNNKKTKFKPRKKMPKISELFYNNHFVMGFSVLCALIIWFIMGFTNTTERPREINDVPVEIELSTAAQEENLKVFQQSETTATVSVSGSSVVVNRLQPDDIKAYAKFSPSSASTIGGKLTEYTLPLEAKKVTNELADYQLVSVYPTEVTVLIDRYQEKILDVESDISYGFNDQYFYNTPTLSEDSVTISGPESSVSKVTRVVAEYKTDEVLTSTKVFECKLIPYDENGKVVEDQYLEFSTEKIDATVSVFPRKEVTLTPSAINMPKSFSRSRIQADPSKIVIAGPEDALKNLTSITLDPIDFSNVNLDTTELTTSVTLPAGFRNISNTWNVSVSLDLSDYSQRQLELTSGNITVKNASDTQDVSVLTDSMHVQAIGPENQILSLASDDVYATIDMTGQTDVYGTVELPVTVGFTDAEGCWAYGKYTATVTIQKK